MRARLWLLAFLALCSAGTIVSGWQVHAWGDALSPVDPYSEANALRAVDGFRAQGVWHDAGLGNVLFGKRYPADGFAGDPDSLPQSVAPGGVYTHYPPGPEYLLYAAEALMGPQPVSRLRLLPLALGWVAAVYFGLSLRQRFGPMAAWLTMAACATVPAFHDANSSVHLLGYVLALLLVEISIGVGRNRAVPPYLLLGFAQGWLSFDYALLVALLPLALEVSLPHLGGGEPARLRLALLRSACAAIGLGCAFALHLAQVSAFYGALQPALADLLGSASYRASSRHFHGFVHYIISYIGIIYLYAVSAVPVKLPWGEIYIQFPFTEHLFWIQGLTPNDYRPWFEANAQAGHALRFLGVTLGPWWLAASLLHLAGVLRPRGAGGWRGWFVVTGSGLAACSAWWLAMPNHASVHVHLMYRHLLFLFLLMVLYWAVRLAPLLERTLGRARSRPAAA